MLRPINSHIRHCYARRAAALWEIVKDEAENSEAEARGLVELGAVYLEKRRELNPERPVKEGTYLRIHLFPRRYQTSHVDWPKCVIEANDDFVIVNKPPGVPLISTVDNVHDNVIAKMSHALGRTVYVTHRIDKGTRGFAVLAVSKTFQTRFNQLLADRSVQKKYRALTKNPLPLGKHLHYMEPKKHAPMELDTMAHEHWFPCELEIETVSEIKLRDGNAYEHVIRLITGRTHQIRRQLSFLGSSILGDLMYGGEEVAGFSQDAMALQSFELTFDSRTFILERDW